MNKHGRTSCNGIAIIAALRVVLFASTAYVTPVVYAFSFDANDLENAVELASDAGEAFGTARDCWAENVDRNITFCDRVTKERAVDIVSEKIGDKVEEQTQKAAVMGIKKLAKKIGWKGAARAAAKAAKSLPAVNQVITAGEAGWAAGSIMYKNVVEPSFENWSAEKEKRRNKQVFNETAFMRANKYAAKEYLRISRSDGPKAADAYLKREMQFRSTRDAASLARDERTARTSRPRAPDEGVQRSAADDDSTPDDDHSDAFLAGDADFSVAEHSDPGRSPGGGEDDDPIANIGQAMNEFDQDVEERRRGSDAELSIYEDEVEDAVHVALRPNGRRPLPVTGRNSSRGSQRPDIWPVDDMDAMYDACTDSKTYIRQAFTDTGLSSEDSREYLGGFMAMCRCLDDFEDEKIDLNNRCLTDFFGVLDVDNFTPSSSNAANPAPPSRGARPSKRPSPPKSRPAANRGYPRCPPGTTDTGTQCCPPEKRCGVR